jgi:hypothetical protein
VISLIGVATAKSREKAARRRGDGAILSETFFFLLFFAAVGSSVQAVDGTKLSTRVAFYRASPPHGQARAFCARESLG